MLASLVARWKQWRANEHEHEIERALDKQSAEAESPHDQGPGGWSPLGDLSKLSDDD